MLGPHEIRLSITPASTPKQNIIRLHLTTYNMTERLASLSQVHYLWEMKCSAGEEKLDGQGDRGLDILMYRYGEL